MGPALYSVACIAGSVEWTVSGVMTMKELAATVHGATGIRAVKEAEVTTCRCKQWHGAWQAVDSDGALHTLLAACTRGARAGAEAIRTRLIFRVLHSAGGAVEATPEEAHTV